MPGYPTNMQQHAAPRDKRDVALDKAEAALREYLAVDVLRMTDGCPIERAVAARAQAERALADIEELLR